MESKHKREILNIVTTFKLLDINLPKITPTTPNINMKNAMLTLTDNLINNTKKTQVVKTMKKLAILLLIVLVLSREDIINQEKIKGNTKLK
jgi:hypothetical protein